MLQTTVMTVPAPSSQGSTGVASSAAPRPPEPSAAALRLAEILGSAVAHGASDVHIRAGIAPTVRVNGQLWALEMPPLTPEESLDLVLAAMPTDRDRRAFLDEMECDFALMQIGRASCRERV